MHERVYMAIGAMGELLVLTQHIVPRAAICSCKRCSPAPATNVRCRS